MSYVKGNFKKAIFQSYDTGYLIGLLKVKESSEDLHTCVGKTITFTGYIPELNELDTYRLEGKMIQHQKYGEQFEVTNFERILPTENDAMLDILSSDMFKGIGKKTAEKIVNVFHENTFEVILHRSSDLLLVPGITAKQVQTLHEAMLSYQGNYETILALTTLGFTPRDAMRIYHFYKEKTNEVLQRDLYQIYYDMEEVSFKKIDPIALKAGYEPLGLERVCAIMIYIMREVVNTYGHTYCLESEIMTYFLRITHQEISEALHEQALLRLQEKDLVVQDGQNLYLKVYYDAEVFIARRLRLLAHEPPITIANFEEILKEVEAKNGLMYNKEQKQAIYEALTSQVLVITGGPGAGKTTIIKAIIDVYQHIHHYDTKTLMTKLALLAPTGRASKRMGEVASLQASTIHRFLKWNKDTNRFQLNEYHRSEAEFVIIDESSMVDTLLLANLLRGLSVHCRVIFVGDADQLPSVGAGNLLEDIIQSETLSVIALQNIYRQGSGSHIISLAHAIKEGNIPADLWQEKDDLVFIECQDQEILSTLEKSILQFDPDTVQVLVPMYKSAIGIDTINQHLQELLNPKTVTKKELTTNEVVFREQDKVIQLTNVPDDNVFNGDIGQIDRIMTVKKKELWVDFDGNIVHYTPAMLTTLRHAYAISIHKSQGSEFPIVIMPISMVYQKMLYRKLIYTGVTRAKKQLILIGNKKALDFAIHRHIDQQRRTSLQHFLKNGILF